MHTEAVWKNYQKDWKNRFKNTQGRDKRHRKEAWISVTERKSRPSPPQHRNRVMRRAWKLVATHRATVTRRALLLPACLPHQIQSNPAPFLPPHSTHRLTYYLNHTHIYTCHTHCHSTYHRLLNDEENVLENDLGAYCYLTWKPIAPLWKLLWHFKVGGGGLWHLLLIVLQAGFIIRSNSHAVGRFRQIGDLLGSRGASELKD